MFNKTYFACFCLLCGYFPDPLRFKRFPFGAVAKRKAEKIQPSSFLFATAKVASKTAIIFFHTILNPAVLIYDFHIFNTIESGNIRKRLLKLTNNS